MNNSFLQQTLTSEHMPQPKLSRDSAVSKNFALTFNAIVSDSERDQSILYVIAGAPNTGKSTFIKQCILKQCDKILSKDTNKSSTQISTPFYIDCRSIVNINVNSQVKRNIQQKGFIKYMIEQQEAQYSKLLIEEYDSKNLLVYIDGIDQIGQFKYQVLQIIRDLLQNKQLNNVVICLRHLLLSQLKGLDKIKIFQMQMPFDALTVNNMRKQMNSGQFEKFNQFQKDVKIVKLISNYQMLQLTIYLDKKKALVKGAFLNKLGIKKSKIHVMWNFLKHLSKIQIQDESDLQDILTICLPAIAFEALTRNLKDFSEVDFHRLQRFNNWKKFLKTIGKPSIKDCQRLLFSMSEQICTFLDAMNSFMINSTLDMNRTTHMLSKNASNKVLIKNKQSLKDKIQEGKPYMINDYLNNSGYSFISETSNEDAKIETDKDLNLDIGINYAYDTKFPTPQRLSLTQMPTPQDIYQRAFMDNNPNNILLQSFVVEPISKEYNSRNPGIVAVESCLIEENEEAITNKPVIGNHGIQGITQSNLNIINQEVTVINKKKLQFKQNPSNLPSHRASGYINDRHLRDQGLHNRDESTATLLMEKSPVSTQRSKINLNALMDAYNNLNKHPSVLAFNHKKLDDEKLRFNLMMNNQNLLQQLNMVNLPISGRESALSLNPYAQGAIDFEDEEGNINRFVDIFRFSSIQFQHFLAAEHMFQVISSRDQKKLKLLNLGEITHMEQMQQTLRYLEKLLVIRSIKKQIDYVKIYLGLMISNTKSIFILNRALSIIQRFSDVITQHSKLFKLTLKTRDDLIELKYKLLLKEDFSFLKVMPTADIMRPVLLILHKVIQKLEPKSIQEDQLNDFILIIDIVQDFTTNQELYKLKSRKEHQIIFDISGETNNSTVSIASSATKSTSNNKNSLLSPTTPSKLDRFSVGTQSSQSNNFNNSKLSSVSKRTINLDKANNLQKMSFQQQQNLKNRSQSSSNTYRQGLTVRDQSILFSPTSAKGNNDEKQRELKWKEILHKDKKIVEETAIKLISIFIESDEQINKNKTEKFQFYVKLIDTLIIMGCNLIFVQDFIAAKIKKVHSNQKINEKSRKNQIQVLKDLLMRFGFLSEQSFLTLIDTSQNIPNDTKKDTILLRIDKNIAKHYALKQLTDQNLDQEKICKVIKSFQLSFNQNVINLNSQILKILSYFVDDSDSKVQLAALQTLNEILSYYSNLEITYVISDAQSQLAAVPHVLKDRIQMFNSDDLTSYDLLQCQIIKEQVRCCSLLYLIFDSHKKFGQNHAKFQNVVVENQNSEYFMDSLDHLVSDYIIKSFFSIQKHSGNTQQKQTKLAFLEILDKTLTANKILKTYIVQEIINFISLLAADVNPTNIQLTKLILHIILKIIDYVNDNSQIQVIKTVVWKVIISFFEDNEIKQVAFDIVCSSISLAHELNNLIQSFININKNQNSSELIVLLSFKQLLKHISIKRTKLEWDLSQAQMSYRQSVNSGVGSVHEKLLDTSSYLNQDTLRRFELGLSEQKSKRKIPMINQSLKKTQINMSKLVEKQSKLSIGVRSANIKLNPAQSQPKSKQSSELIQKISQSKSQTKEPQIVNFQIQNINQSLYIDLNSVDLSKRLENLRVIESQVKALIESLNSGVRQPQSPSKNIQKYQSIFSSPDNRNNQKYQDITIKENNLILSLDQPTLVPQYRSLMASPTQKNMKRSGDLDDFPLANQTAKRKKEAPKTGNLAQFKRRSGSSTNMGVRKFDQSFDKGSGQLSIKQEIDFRDMDRLKEPSLQIQKSVNKPSDHIVSTKVMLSQSQPRKHKVFLRNMQKYMNPNMNLHINIQQAEKSPKRINIQDGSVSQRKQKSPNHLKSNISTQNSVKREPTPTKSHSKMEQTYKSKIIVHSQQQSQMNQILSANKNNQQKPVEESKVLNVKASNPHERQKVYTTFQKRDMSFEVSVSARGKAESQYLENGKYLTTQEQLINDGQEDGSIRGINSNQQREHRQSNYSSEFSGVKLQSKINQFQQISRTNNVNRLQSSATQKGFMSHDVYDSSSKVFDSPQSYDELNYVSPQLQSVIKKMEIYNSLFNPPKLTKELLKVLQDNIVGSFQVDQYIYSKIKETNKLEELEYIVELINDHHELFCQYKKQALERLIFMIVNKHKNLHKLIILLHKLQGIQQDKSLQLFEIMIENFILDEVKDTQIEKVIDGISEASISLLVKTFQLITNEDEVLIKILYKLEILLNYDSPENSQKSQIIRQIGQKIIKGLEDAKVNIYQNTEQFKQVLNHFVFAEKLQSSSRLNQDELTLIQSFCINSLITFFQVKKKANVFYVMPNDVFEWLFVDQEYKSGMVKSNYENVIDCLMEIFKQMNIFSINQLEINNDQN